MKINSYFDKIYCINLDRRPDRWKKMSEQFFSLGLSVERIQAFDSWSLPHDKGTAKQRGRYACTESHLMAIQNAADSNLKRILILEDDCILPHDFNEKLEIYLACLPNDWHMLLLGYYAGPNFNKEAYSQEKVLRLKKNATKHDGLWAAHAYCLNESIFEKILNSKNGAFSLTPHEDNGEGYGCIDITYYYAFHGVYNCYAVNPSLVEQDKSDTDIDVISTETRSLVGQEPAQFKALLPSA